MTRHVVSFLGLVTSLSFAWGCAPPFFPLTDLTGAAEAPAGVSAVKESRKSFADVSDEGLLNTSAGDVIDDLSGLTGCWGAWIPVEDFAGFEDYEFYCFDMENSRFIYQVLQNDPIFTGMYVALQHTYDIDSVAADGITFHLTDMAAWSNVSGFTGAIGDFGEFDEMDDLDEPTTLKITLSGDRFIIHAAADASPDLSAAYRAGVIYLRFDCPPDPEATVQ